MILINDRPASADLVELIILDFGFIMGMDWLAGYYAHINCRTKIIRLYFPNESVLEWKGNAATHMGKIISYLRARKFIAKGCVYNIVNVKDIYMEPTSF